MTTCDQELCEYWTGHGCACEVLDIDREKADADEDANRVEERNG